MFSDPDCCFRFLMQNVAVEFVDEGVDAMGFVLVENYRWRAQDTSNVMFLE